MITCTFAGHARVYEAQVESRVRAALEELLQMDDAFCFLSGGMGAFDRLCEGLVLEAKKLHPQKRIQLLLVLPYMPRNLNVHRRYYDERYDEIVLPAELDGRGYKSSIPRRNRWMVDRSEYMIAYVWDTTGNSYKTLRYAQRKHLTIWNVALRNRFEIKH